MPRIGEEKGSGIFFVVLLSGQISRRTPEVLSTRHNVKFKEKIVARYRCVFLPSFRAADNEDDQTLKGVGVVYEFEAPDKKTLELWLLSRNLRPSAIQEMNADKTLSLGRLVSR